MSKSIIIETNGVEHSYSNVKKIKTKDANRNSTTWIPDSETKLKKKSIKKNGTYKAVNDDCYGYSEVRVRVTSATIGKRNNKMYKIGVSDDGFFTEEIMPDNMKMITEPTKSVYNVGEEINLSGAVIKLYSGNDLWTDSTYPDGIIPINQLRTEPETAEETGAVNVFWEDVDDIDIEPVSFEIEVGENE